MFSLRNWFRKFHTWAFGEEWRGADHLWSPVQTTTHVGNSDAFDELEMHRAFDAIAEDFAREPDWLVVFKSKTEYMTFHLNERDRQEAWERKYAQLSTDTAYTVRDARQLVLALS